MPKRSEIKLSERFVRDLQPDPDGKDVTAFFRDVPGLGVRVKPSGTKTYFFQYRDPFGQQRKMVVGPVWTAKRKDGLAPTEAVDKALKMRVAVRENQDPSAARDGRRNAKTVSQLCDEHLKAAALHLRPNTLIMERSRIENHVRPLLGPKPVASLTPGDLEQFLADVSAGKTKKPKAGAPVRGGKAQGGKAAASRTLEMLGTILERAVRDGIVATNPARKIQKPKRNPIKPAFSFARVEAVGKAMRELEAEGEGVNGIRAIRHLLLSGFRRMEGLTLRWVMVDAPAHCARLADTKTGPQVRPLGKSALDHLASFKPDAARPKDYVFPGDGKSGHYVGAPKAWARISKRAKISGVSLHGLRHWFASAGAEMNFSELVIAGLIGHKVRSVTGRYATTPDAALVVAADAISARLATALGI
jgi:integrase